MKIIYIVLIDIEEDFGKTHQELEHAFSTLELALAHVNKTPEFKEYNSIIEVTLDRPDIPDRIIDLNNPYS